MKTFIQPFSRATEKINLVMKTKNYIIFYLWSGSERSVLNVFTDFVIINVFKKTSFQKYLFGNIFKKYIQEISFQICWIGIIHIHILSK